MYRIVPRIRATAVLPTGATRSGGGFLGRVVDVVAGVAGLACVVLTTICVSISNVKKG